MFNASTQTRLSAETKGTSAYKERVSVVSQRDSAARSFSINWVIASTVLYLVMQVVLGMVVQSFVLPFIVAQHTRSFTEGLIIILGFYIGSFIIGVVSPGRRILEPALGAVAAIIAAFSVANFTPQMGGWFRVDGIEMMGTAALFAGSISAFGAYSAEKLMGNTTE